MNWYSDFPARRTWQTIGDLIGVATIVLAIVAGVAVHTFIVTFADVGAQLEEAGAGFADTMTDVGENLGAVPLIGAGIRAPFDTASDAGTVLADAGQAQQDFVTQGALLAAVLVAVGPILAVLVLWLLPRLYGARRAREARTLAGSPDGHELLALRALATRPFRDLATVHVEPLTAWRERDTDAVRGLAQLELRRVGVRLR
ncbi:MAG: hypothetical protein CMF56_06070 [Leifsonia sp.]|nr:hypothetical protein [Leifsonia sp.]|tara:strand:- start:165072 stop:165674 length:603 start_codon:yes stop_codon:yes gene_type:complete